MYSAKVVRLSIVFEGKSLAGGVSRYILLKLL